MLETPKAAALVGRRAILRSLMAATFSCVFVASKGERFSLQKSGGGKGEVAAAATGNLTYAARYADYLKPHRIEWEQWHV